MSMRKFGISKAAELCKESNADAVIIIQLKESDGILPAVSYGRNKKFCKFAGKLMEAAMQHVEDNYASIRNKSLLEWEDLAK